MLNTVRLVTPLAGVWIEIGRCSQSARRTRVTPLAGVWIEIAKRANQRLLSLVTPLAGVWIEMHNLSFEWQFTQSLPLRECGLKSDSDFDDDPIG